mmetsp:Transcript_71551/g.165464  ORF Transcript_71551/g.165464 Transcript_71551/m.165464 type:complete len:200 (+) Transcript_71551:368-967(+)
MFLLTSRQACPKQLQRCGTGCGRQSPGLDRGEQDPHNRHRWCCAQQLGTSASLSQWSLGVSSSACPPHQVQESSGGRAASSVGVSKEAKSGASLWTRRHCKREASQSVCQRRQVAAWSTICSSTWAIAFTLWTRLRSLPPQRASLLCWWRSWPHCQRTPCMRCRCSAVLCCCAGLPARRKRGTWSQLWPQSPATPRSGT